MKKKSDVNLVSVMSPKCVSLSLVCLRLVSELVHASSCPAVVPSTLSMVAEVESFLEERRFD